MQRRRAALEGYRILVVEDEALLAIQTRNVLKAEGAEVIGPVPSVPAALAALSAKRPHAALLDCNLRGLWSTPVAEALHSAGIPFVLVTGHDRMHFDHPAMRNAPIVPKPAAPGDLVRELRQVLHGDRKASL